MKHPHALLLGLILSGTAALHAQSVVQTVNFNQTATYTDVTGSQQLVDSSFFTGTFDPFNASLGTLDSFTIEWTLANTATGNLGNAGGSVLLSVVGSLTINDTGYHNAVTGNDAAGGPPNLAFSLSAPIAETDTFLVSGAGTDYSYAFLSAATGDSPFSIGFTAPVNFSVSNSATFDASTTGSVKLTYNYSAVPEPSTYALILGAAALGFVFVRRRRLPARCCYNLMARQR